MKSFIVTTIDKARRKRTRVVRIAKDWHECWTEAINEFGINVVISVRPAR